MWELFETVRQARERGEDPLKETAKNLRKQIRSAKAQLAALRAEAGA